MKQRTFEVLERIAVETKSSVAELIRTAIDEFLQRSRRILPQG
jgi:hypothetical protein